ncbi:MAG: hypothetical protein IJH36_13145 [Clostridia bacterium]|nr:hypothetical protein [Clostridia bacterium]
MKKRITSLLLCFSIILSIVPSAFAEDGDIALQSGTQMYYITNAEELKALDGVYGGYAKLMNDITLEGEWEWINFSGGYFDGNGHTISGLTITEEPETHIAALMWAQNIKDLNVSGVNINFTISDTRTSVGVLSGSLDNCTLSGNINVNIAGTVESTWRTNGPSVGGMSNAKDSVNNLSSTVTDPYTDTSHYGYASMLSDCTDCVNNGSLTTKNVNAAMLMGCDGCINNGDLKCTFDEWYLPTVTVMTRCKNCETTKNISASSKKDIAFTLFDRCEDCNANINVSLKKTGSEEDSRACSRYIMSECTDCSFTGSFTENDGLALYGMSGCTDCLISGTVSAKGTVYGIYGGSGNYLSGTVKSTYEQAHGISGGTDNVMRGTVNGAGGGVAVGGGKNNSFYGDAVCSDTSGELYGAIYGIGGGEGCYMKGTVKSTRDAYGIGGGTENSFDGNITATEEACGIGGGTDNIMRGDISGGTAKGIGGGEGCKLYGDVTAKDGAIGISGTGSYMEGTISSQNEYRCTGIINGENCVLRADIKGTGIQASDNCILYGDVDGTGIYGGYNSYCTGCEVYGNVDGTGISGGNYCTINGDITDFWSDAMRDSTGSVITGKAEGNEQRQVFYNCVNCSIDRFITHYGSHTFTLTQEDPKRYLYKCNHCGTETERVRPIDQDKRQHCTYTVWKKGGDGDWYSEEAHGYYEEIFAADYSYGNEIKVIETPTPSPSESPAPSPSASPVVTPTPVPTPTPTPAPKTYQLRVIDTANGKPIEGAVIKNMDTDSRYTTDKNGIASVSLKEKEANKIAVEMADVEIYADLHFIPVKDRINDISVQTISVDPNDIRIGSASNDTMKGPNISVLGESFPLFEIPINIDFSSLDSVNVQYDAKDKTWKAVIGYTQKFSDWKNSVMTKPFGDQFNNMKKLYNAANSGGITKDVLKDVNTDSDFPGSLTIQGFMTLGLNQKKEVVVKEGGIVVIAQAAIGGSYPIPAAPYIFLTYSLTGTLSGGITLKLEDSGVVEGTQQTAQKPKFKTTGNIGVELGVSGGIGAGVNKILSAEVGLTGKLGAQLNFPFESMKKSFEAKLSADIYITLSALIFRSTFSKTFYELTIYPWNRTSTSSLMSIDDESDFEMVPRDYLYDGISLSSADTNEIKQNLYPYSSVKAAKLGDGRVLLVWLDDDAERADADRTALYYTVVTDGTAGEARQINNDGTADFDFDISASAGKAAIVWQNTNKTFTSDVTMPEMAASTELTYAEFDGEAWSSPVSVKEANTDYEYSPKLSYTADKSYIIWTQNDENTALVGSSDLSESICRAEIENATPSTSQKIADNLSLVLDSAVSSSGTVAYVSDGDGELATDPCELYIDGALKYTSDNLISSLSADGGGFVFAENGVLRRTDNEETGIVSDVKMSQDIRRLENAVIFKTDDGFSSDLYVSYKTEGGYTAPLKITDNTEKIRSWDAYEDSGGNIYAVMVLAAVAVTDDSLTESARLTIDMLEPPCDLIVNSVETRDDITRGEEAAFNINITNNSCTDISNVNVTLTGKKSGELFNASVSVNIKSGGNADVPVTLTIPEDFEGQTITAVVTTSDIEENDTDNNSASDLFGLADLEVSLDGMSISSNGEAYITVENIGCAEAENITVTLTDNSAEEIFTETIERLPAGEKKELTVSDIAASFEGGEESLIYSAYAQCDSEEAHAYNNSASYTVTAPKNARLRTDLKTVSLNIGECYSPDITSTSGLLDLYVTSGNEAVAAVDENGVITGAGEGSTEIVYLTPDSALPLRITVFVHEMRKPQISNLTKTDYSVSMNVDTTDCILEGELATLLFALYDSEGRLITLQTQTAEYSDALPVEIYTYEQNISSVKVMLWNSLEAMKPVSLTAEADVTEGL